MSFPTTTNKQSNIKLIIILSFTILALVLSVVFGVSMFYPNLINKQESANQEQDNNKTSNYEEISSETEPENEADTENEAQAMSAKFGGYLNSEPSLKKADTSAMFLADPNYKADPEIFYEIKKNLKDRYIDTSKLGLLDISEPNFGSFKSQNEYYTFLRDYIGSLGDKAMKLTTKEEIQRIYKIKNVGKVVTGSMYNTNSGDYLITGVMKGSSYETAGVVPGLVLVGFDGYKVEVIEGMIFPQMITKEGENKELVFKNPQNNKYFKTNIKYKESNFNFMEVSFVQDVAVVRILTFSAITPLVFKEKWSEVKNQINSKGITKIVFDLRGNTGGNMDAAKNLASEFLNKGDTIFHSLFRVTGSMEPLPKMFPTTNTTQGDMVDVKVAILIDEISASSSELFTSALKENRQDVVVIGQNSYGKGSGQMTLILKDFSEMTVTTDRWFTPKGRNLNKDERIVPDIKMVTDIDSLLLGRDNLVEEAVRVLKTK